MSRATSATLSANTNTCGPVNLNPELGGIYSVVVTGTITVTLQASFDGGANWVSDPDSVHTASTLQRLTGGGMFRLIASGVSGGNAVCSMEAH